MKIKCPNCPHIYYPRDTGYLPLEKCDLCKQVCCWNCERKHNIEHHHYFTQLTEKESKEFLFEEISCQ